MTWAHSRTPPTISGQWVPQVCGYIEGSSAVASTVTDHTYCGRSRAGQLEKAVVVLLVIDLVVIIRHVVFVVIDILESVSLGDRQ